MRATRKERRAEQNAARRFPCLVTGTRSAQERTRRDTARPLAAIAPSLPSAAAACILPHRAAGARLASTAARHQVRLPSGVERAPSQGLTSWRSAVWFLFDILAALHASSAKSSTRSGVASTRDEASARAAEASGEHQAPAAVASRASCGAAATCRSLPPRAHVVQSRMRLLIRALWPHGDVAERHIAGTREPAA